MTDDNAWFEVLSHGPFFILYLYRLGWGNERQQRTAAKIAKVLVLSNAYHLCKSEVVCVVDIWFQQLLDHYGVWDYAFYTLFTGIGFELSTMTITTDYFQILLLLFSRLLPSTVVFPIVYCALYVLWTIVRWTWYGVTPPPVCPVLYFSGMLFMLGGAWFQYSVSSIYDSNYPRRHPYWHLCVLTGSALQDLSTDHFVIPWLHLDGYARVATDRFNTHYKRLMLGWMRYFNKDRPHVHRN